MRVIQLAVIGAATQFLVMQIISAAPVQAAPVLMVDLDVDADTLSITGTGAPSPVTFSTGNFPYIELNGFFADTTNTLVFTNTPVSQNLRDTANNSYQYLFDASWFITVDPSSLGVLNSTLNVHVFQSGQAAFTGTTVWSIAGLGIDITDINASGDVFANQNSRNDGAETLIGQWESNANAAVPEPSSIALLATGAFGFMGYGWRRKRKQAA